MRNCILTSGSRKPSATAFDTRIEAIAHPHSRQSNLVGSAGQSATTSAIEVSAKSTVQSTGRGHSCAETNITFCGIWNNTSDMAMTMPKTRSAIEGILNWKIVFVFRLLAFRILLLRFTFCQQMVTSFDIRKSLFAACFSPHHNSSPSVYLIFHSLPACMYIVHCSLYALIVSNRTIIEYLFPPMSSTQPHAMTRSATRVDSIWWPGHIYLSVWWPGLHSAMQSLHAVALHWCTWCIMMAESCAEIHPVYQEM